MPRRMMLIALEDVHAREIGHDRLARHARGEHQLLGLQDDVLAVAQDDDRPFLASSS